MARKAFSLIFIALNIFISSSWGQTKKAMKEKFFQAEMNLLYEEFNEALPLYQELEEYNPANFNYKYRIGICFLNTPGEKEKALPYLQQAVMNINPKYKEGRFKEELAPYEAFYYLGDAYRVTNQLDKALATYEKFKEGLDPKLYNPEIVDQQIEACNNAKKLMQAPLYLKRENLGELINDRFSEINPVLSADESTLVFTRELQLQDQIFFSKKSNGKWTPPIVIMDQLLVDEGNTTSLSNDGTELFLYQSDQYIGNIYHSRYIDGRWQPAEKLNDNINTKYWESHAVISPDGQRLYFTSNRKGGFGGLDIYYSDKDSTGDWGPAVNIGPVINTPFNEETPFLDKTGKLLFFSSRGHFNMGGHDVFYSTLLENGDWSVPVNMGYPVNSTDDDTFFSPVGDGYVAYVSSFDENGFGKRDLFRVEIFSDEHPRKFMIRGLVTLRDLMNQFTDSVKVSALTKLSLDTLVAVYSDPQTGEYEFEVPQGDYRLVYQADGAETKTADLNIELTNPEDSVIIPKTELPKTDFIAEIDFQSDTLIEFIPEDTIGFTILTEPNSLLVAEHFLDDKLINRAEYMVTDTLFDYPMNPMVGHNKFIFTLKDRFNNVTIKEFYTDIAKPVITEPVIEEAAQVLITEVADSITKPTIEEQIKQQEVTDIDNIVTQVTDIGENESLKTAVQKTKEKNIKNAGEWLGSLYSVAIESGAEQELLATLIAAMSANKGDNAGDYLTKLYEYASENLRKALDEIDTKKINARNPEDMISYLLANAGKYNYTRDNVFEAFAKMINEKEKTAEEIVDYIKVKEGGRLWLLWLLMGAAFTSGVVIVFRKRKNKRF